MQFNVLDHTTSVVETLPSRSFDSITETGGPSGRRVSAATGAGASGGSVAQRTFGVKKQENARCTQLAIVI